MLTNIKLTNFKCFEHLELKPARVTILIGPNGTGKSSVLQALMLLAQSQTQGEVVYSGDLVRFRGFEDVAHGKDMGKTVRWEIGGTLPGDLSAGYAYALAVDRHSTTEVQAKLDFGRGKLQGTWTRAGGAADTQFQVGEFHGTVICTPAIGRPLRFLTLQRAGATVDERESARLEHVVLYGISDELARWRFVQAVRGFTQAIYSLQYQGTETLKASEDLGPQGAGLATSLHLRTGREKRELVAGWTRRVTGMGVTIESEPNHNLGVFSTPDHLRQGISIVGEGFATNQLVFLFFELANTPRQGLLGVEEPEIHLHPAGQAKLADLLVEVSRASDVQLLMTTHSEHMLFSLLNNVAEGKLHDTDLAIYAFGRHGPVCSARRLGVTRDGMVEGGLPGFFEANLEAQKRHMEAISKLAAHG